MSGTSRPDPASEEPDLPMPLPELPELRPEDEPEDENPVDNPPSPADVPYVPPPGTQ
jgi:hypothetical protein